MLLTSLLLSAALLPAGEGPKREDINARFRNPDVGQSIKSFEGESREIYQKRDEILAACELRAGLDVADLGAGTGLFTRMFAPQAARERSMRSISRRSSSSTSRRPAANRT